MDSATPWEGDNRRWINPVKAVKPPEKNPGGYDDGRKVIHAYHKRSSAIKVGEKVVHTIKAYFVS